MYIPKNTVNITNITHNHHYSQKNELKANKTEVHNDNKNKSGEEDAMDKKTLVLGIIAIVAILVIALSFFASTSDNSSTDLQDTSQVSSSDSGSVASSENTAKKSDLLKDEIEFFI